MGKRSDNYRHYPNSRLFYIPIKHPCGHTVDALVDPVIETIEEVETVMSQKICWVCWVEQANEAVREEEQLRLMFDAF